MKIIIERKYFKKDYTIGSLTIEGTSFKCDTLEPPTRPAGTLPRVGGGLPQKGYYAIPEGSYWVRLCMSSKFRGWRPYLMAVPGRSGIMIHEGNTPADTHGCILVGENKVKGKVLNSRATFRMIMDYIYKAEEVGEAVEVVVSS